MGFAALEAGHFQQALELFHQALDECPNSPVIWNNLGCVYYRQGKYKKAKPCFEQAIRLNLSFSRALLNLAAVEFRQGEYLRAYRTYCLARKIDREYVMSRLRNAQSQGKIDDCVTQFQGDRHEAEKLFRSELQLLGL